ncbi:hypothetical protein HYS91_02645 [Candidatus Daviesbacteria bacterium]|nr:hypothetical protein [Candidatus Daviesbacteria bacterium]
MNQFSQKTIFDNHIEENYPKLVSKTQLMLSILSKLIILSVILILILLGIPYIEGGVLGSDTDVPSTGSDASTILEQINKRNEAPSSNQGWELDSAEGPWQIWKSSERILLWDQRSNHRAVVIRRTPNNWESLMLLRSVLNQQIPVGTQGLLKFNIAPPGDPEPPPFSTVTTNEFSNKACVYSQLDNGIENCYWGNCKDSSKNCGSTVNDNCTYIPGKSSGEKLSSCPVGDISNLTPSNYTITDLSFNPPCIYSEGENKCFVGRCEDSLGRGCSFSNNCKYNQATHQQIDCPGSGGNVDISGNVCIYPQAGASGTSCYYGVCTKEAEAQGKCKPYTVSEGCIYSSGFGQKLNSCPASGSLIANPSLLERAAGLLGLGSNKYLVKIEIDDDPNFINVSSDNIYKGEKLNSLRKEGGSIIIPSFKLSPASQENRQICVRYTSNLGDTNSPPCISIRKTPEL